MTRQPLPSAVGVDQEPAAKPEIPPDPADQVLNVGIALRCQDVSEVLFKYSEHSSTRINSLDAVRPRAKPQYRGKASLVVNRCHWAS